MICAPKFVFRAPHQLKRWARPLKIYREGAHAYLRLEQAKKHEVRAFKVFLCVALCFVVKGFDFSGLSG